jgi:hypothetical protein
MPVKTSPAHLLVGLVSAAALVASAQEPITLEALQARAAALAHEVRLLEDEREIEILQRTYGYYVDKNLWREIGQLFAEDGTLEIGGRGIFVGRDRVVEYLEWLGEGEQGRLYDHTQMQGVISVSPDGQTAKGRWRAYVFGGNEGGIGVFGDCIYENEYRKVDGVWKLSKLHSYFIMYTNWDQGWARLGWPNTRPEAVLPPDRPPTIVYDMYPGELTAPMHYENPVTGEPPYADVTFTPPAPQTLGTTETIAAEVRALGTRIERLEDADAIERLHNIYGYYLDDRQWDEVAGLFAADGTIELAQRGVYVGRERVRESLALSGEAGLREGVMASHLQYQPVIHVAEDGRSANLRVREMVLAGEHGGEGQIGGSVYENELVKENGQWKIKTKHSFTTFLADYQLGWSHGALPTPGPSTELPPDRPPSIEYQAFPAFQLVPPFHYPNPGSGRPVTP